MAHIEAFVVGPVQYLRKAIRWAPTGGDPQYLTVSYVAKRRVLINFYVWFITYLIISKFYNFNEFSGFSRKESKYIIINFMELVSIVIISSDAYNPFTILTSQTILDSHRALWLPISRIKYLSKMNPIQNLAWILVRKKLYSLLNCFNWRPKSIWRYFMKILLSVLGVSALKSWREIWDTKIKRILWLTFFIGCLEWSFSLEIFKIVNWTIFCKQFSIKSFLHRFFPKIVSSKEFIKFTNFRKNAAEHANWSF